MVLDILIILLYTHNNIMQNVSAAVLTSLMFHSRLDAKTFIDITLPRFNDFVNRISVEFHFK